MKNVLRWLLLAGLILTSIAFLYAKHETGVLWLVAALVGLLSFFTGVSLVLLKRRAPMARELHERTVTWWWMCAVFLLALSIHRLVSFVFLGFLCFSALREYFSLVPMEKPSERLTLTFKDRPAVMLCYLSIPAVIYLAYIKWYALFIIFVPVYVFLSVPILFVLQNRTQGFLKSIGIIAIGLMLFVHNLGHCLFMINMGAMVLVYCFALTEIRDLVSFWIGKGLAVAGERTTGWLARVLTAKVAPDVSPRKTWATGILSACLIAGLSVVFVPYMPAMPDGRLTPGYSVVIGLLIGLTGFFGDLVFSAVKRDIGVKDSGSMLPGHGGIIDRVDALVFTIPVTFHLLFWRYY